MQRWGVLFVVLAALVVGACGGGGSGGTSGGGGGGGISSLTITYGPSAPTASMRTESVTIPFTAMQPAGSTTSWTLAASTSGAISVSNMSIQPTTVAAGQTQVSGTVTFTAVSGKGSIRITGTPNTGSNVLKSMVFTIADRGVTTDFASPEVQISQGGVARINVRFYPDPNSLSGVAQVPIQLDQGLTSEQPTAYVPIVAGNTSPVEMEYTVRATSNAPIGSNLTARVPLVTLVQNLIEGDILTVAIQPPADWDFYHLAVPPFIKLKPGVWSAPVRFDMHAIGDPPAALYARLFPNLEQYGLFIDPPLYGEGAWPIDFEFNGVASTSRRFLYVPGNLTLPFLYKVRFLWIYQNITYEYIAYLTLQLDETS